MRQQGVLEQNDQRWATEVPELPHAQPTSMDQSKLESARKSAHAVADVLFDEKTAGKAAHTDIFATLHLAAAEIRAADGRQGYAVRAFCQEYFKATGAVLMPQNYQIASASAERLGCEFRKSRSPCGPVFP